MKAFFHLGGPLLALIGTIISVGGTYLMTRLYHPFGGLNFLRSLLRIIWLLITRQRKTLANMMEGAPQFASIENRARSLAGVYILFVGLFIQAVGGALTIVDVLLDRTPP
jgi:hypothetical protein